MDEKELRRAAEERESKIMQASAYVTRRLLLAFCFPSIGPAEKRVRNV